MHAPFLTCYKIINRHISSCLQVPPQETVAAYSNLSFEEVVRELIKQKEVVRKKDSHIRELEDYIDNLLVRVMEETPSILRTPYEPKRKAGKISKKWGSKNNAFCRLDEVNELVNWYCSQEDSTYWKSKTVQRSLTNAKFMIYFLFCFRSFFKNHLFSLRSE